MKSNLTMSVYGFVGIIIALLIVQSALGIPVVIEPCPPGTPVADSIFSEFVGTSSLVQNMTDLVSTENVFRVGYPKDVVPDVNLSEASKSVESFLSTNYPWLNDTLVIQSLGLLEYIPAWRLEVHSGSIILEMWVSARTGNVLHLGIWSGHLRNEPYYPNGSMIEPEVATDLVKSFLTLNDLKIPSDARYLGILTPTHNFDDRYLIGFMHVVGSVPFVSNAFIDYSYQGEGILFQVDSYYGTIIAFHYLWRDVGTVSSSGVISQERACEIALSLDEIQNGTIVMCNLTVSDVGASTTNSSDDEIRLVWRVVMNNPFRTDVLIDASTGEVVEVQRFRSSLDHLPPLAHGSLYTAILIISLSFGLAILIFIIIHKVLGGG